VNPTKPPGLTLTPVRLFGQMPWWESALAALPLLAEEDPWSADDLNELSNMLSEADLRAQATDGCIHTFIYLYIYSYRYIILYTYINIYI